MSNQRNQLGNSIFGQMARNPQHGSLMCQEPTEHRGLSQSYAAIHKPI